ncbi:hypothetical protein IAQ61_007417 [Plenodomus lingam]|uniref:Predicted protein n=1 Tax=Leptosphaeria maculans (strain JN3 / isolate v23.1.3 / race Av1-4-5-6-7-8) TaxID=985895 RepID=E5A5S7_LEPMJ|nr:predicted protein [Plenodomus lingam JN3]KAH9866828.1 hypothetical protein IAQ61_007417 [Plenodomus lingam]CBX98975.1 predicted protein [Plenodomus lingam JN3]
MAIARYSSKRTHDEAVFSRLHALTPCKQGSEIARWVVAVADSEAGHDDVLPTAKRQRVLRSLHTTSHRVKTAKRNMAAASPTRRLKRDRSPAKKNVVVATRRKGRQGGLEEADADVQQSAVNAFSEGTPSLPAPASSLRSLSPPKRKTASTKADLAYLNPNIEFFPLRHTGETGILLPVSVTELWSRCEKRQLDPLTTDPPVPLTDKDHRIINDTLSDAFEQAEKWRDTTTEPHWISVVVGPILHLLRRIECFKNSAVPNARIAVLDVTPIEISPAELVPFSKDPVLYRDLDKRIDYVVGLDLHRTTLKTLRRTKYCTAAPSINQTASFANETPIFLNIEVKRRHVARDPTVQLAAWIAAEFTKRRYEEWDLGFPVFTVEIDGDNWLLRVAAARVVLRAGAAAESPGNGEGNAPETEAEEGPTTLPEDEYELFFFGPLALGDTLTLEGSKRLLANLIDITKWGQSEFRTWWGANVHKVLEKRLRR